MKTHYDNLQVAQNASDRVIRAAWKSLVQEWHPDKNPGNCQEAERVLKIINRAYEVLSNPETRRQHDDWIRSQNIDQYNRKNTQKSNDVDECSENKNQEEVNKGESNNQRIFEVICPGCGIADSALISTTSELPKFKFFTAKDRWAFIALAVFRMTCNSCGNKFILDRYVDQPNSKTK